MKDLPSNAVLVIIDVQKAIDHPSWGRRNNPEAEANIARLLEAWRQTQRPIVHVRHLSTEPNSTYCPGQEGCDFKDIVLPGVGETIVDKRVNCAFIGTELETWLRNRGYQILVVTGVITNNSVEATVRVAGNLGFKTYGVSDGTATFDKCGIWSRSCTMLEKCMPCRWQICTVNTQLLWIQTPFCKFCRNK